MSNKRTYYATFGDTYDQCFDKVKKMADRDGCVLVMDSMVFEVSNLYNSEFPIGRFQYKLEVEAER